MLLGPADQCALGWGKGSSRLDRRFELRPIRLSRPAAPLSGCSSINSVFHRVKKTPNEFDVVQNAPFGIRPISQICGRRSPERANAGVSSTSQSQGGDFSGGRPAGGNCGGGRSAQAPAKTRFCATPGAGKAEGDIRDVVNKEASEDRPLNKGFVGPADILAQRCQGAEQGIARSGAGGGAAQRQIGDLGHHRQSVLEPADHRPENRFGFVFRSPVLTARIFADFGARGGTDADTGWVAGAHRGCSGHGGAGGSRHRPGTGGGVLSGRQLHARQRASSGGRAQSIARPSWTQMIWYKVAPPTRRPANPASPFSSNISCIRAPKRGAGPIRSHHRGEWRQRQRLHHP